MVPNIAVQYFRPYFSHPNVREKIAVWLGETTSGGLSSFFRTLSCAQWMYHALPTILELAPIIYTYIHTIYTHYKACYTHAHTHLYTSMTAQVKIKLAGMSDPNINSGAGRNITTTTDLQYKKLCI